MEKLLKPGSPLYHGGIMVNYKCNAACRHCLYASSPSRKTGYISKDMLELVCKLLKKGNCNSVHIGGGEPFLDFDSLLMVIETLNSQRIRLEYIETNAFWVSDENSARQKIEKLLAKGVNSLCISIDPFHAEYIPYSYPLNLYSLCQKMGMDSFLWKGQFISTLSSLESSKTHSRSQLEEKISSDYLKKTADVYGIRLGGRAVNIEKEYSPNYKLEKLLDDKSCYGLLSTEHFHVDLHGYFIPPGCTGIRIPLSEIVEGINPEKYPVFTSLFQGGIRSLLNFAYSHNFKAEEKGYPSKCNLCFNIRYFLSQYNFVELDGEHYSASFEYI